MIYFLALILPWLAMMIRGLILQGLICLILQITIVGWLPATIWAMFAINNVDNKKRHRELMSALNQNSSK